MTERESDLLNVVSILVDDIGHWGVPPGERCRSTDSIIAMMLDESNPFWLRDTCAFALGTIAETEDREKILAALDRVAASERSDNARKVAEWMAKRIRETEK